MSETVVTQRPEHLLKVEQANFELELEAPVAGIARIDEGLIRLMVNLSILTAP